MFPMISNTLQRKGVLRMNMQSSIHSNDLQIITQCDCRQVEKNVHIWGQAEYILHSIRSVAYAETCHVRPETHNFYLPSYSLE